MLQPSKKHNRRESHLHVSRKACNRGQRPVTQKQGENVIQACKGDVVWNIWQGITAAPAFMFGGGINAKIRPVIEGWAVRPSLSEASAVGKAGSRRHWHSEQPISDG